MSRDLRVPLYGGPADGMAHTIEEHLISVGHRVEYHIPPESSYYPGGHVTTIADVKVTVHYYNAQLYEIPLPDGHTRHWIYISQSIDIDEYSPPFFT